MDVWAERAALDAEAKKVSELRELLSPPAFRTWPSKATSRDVASAIFVAEGNLAWAHRLLCRALEIDLSAGYVRRRVLADPRIEELLKRMRLHARTRQRTRGGKWVCPSCGFLMEPPQAEKEKPAS
jgi:hypothetical protein